MQQLHLSPVSKVDGKVRIPGSKSLSNRALLLAALSKGTTRLHNLLDSDDTKHMLSALRKLGVDYAFTDDKQVCTVVGNGGAFESSAPLDLFLGNAGTAMRPLCAALACSNTEVLLHGEPRMHERPIGDLVDALQTAGANIEYKENHGYPPLNIKPATISASELTVDGSLSSQFLTALLMAAPLIAKSNQSKQLTIKISGELVSKPYIDITLACMKAFGVDVVNNNYESFDVNAEQQYQAVDDYWVESDASSASYFLAAAAIKGGTVEVEGVGSNSIQGDKQFADVLERMGAIVSWQPNSVSVSKGALNGIDMDMNHIPDAAMTIAVAALFAEGKTVIRNIYNWRLKETDRIAAMACELRKVGAIVEEGEDFIAIEPVDTLNHACIDTYNDHRMAMCFSLLALDDDCGVTINDPKCTSKTFPDYFEKFSEISIQ